MEELPARVLSHTSRRNHQHGRGKQERARTEHPYMPWRDSPGTLPYGPLHRTNLSHRHPESPRREARIA